MKKAFVVTYLACLACSMGLDAWPQEQCEENADTQTCVDLMKSRVAELEGELNSARQKIAELERALESEHLVNSGATPSKDTPAKDASPKTVPDETLNEHLASPAVLTAGIESGATGTLDGTTTVTSLTAEQLTLGGVDDISRIDQLVPGLQYGQAGHDVRLSMRGARNNGTGPEARQAVGVYEDGVFVPTTMQVLDPYLDVQEIDILKGPQGITFGRNTIGGAILVRTNDPNHDRIEGRVEGELGKYDRARFEGVFNVPLGDHFAFRFAALAEGYSGMIDNLHIESDADDLKSAKVQLVRASLGWRPGKRFNATLKVKFLDQNSNGTGIWGYQQIGAYIDGEFAPGHQFAPPGFTSDPGPYSVFRNFIAKDDMENLASTLTVNWNMGFAQLEWISNYTEFEGIQLFDSDYSDQGPARESYFAGWNSFQDSYSTELRLSSDHDGPVDWLVGAYLYDRQADWGWLEVNSGLHSQPAWDSTGDYMTDSKAVFGELGYTFNDRWRLSGGLRWFKDSTTLRSGEKGEWDDLLWRVATEVDLSDGTTGYASASTGARAGGINTNQVTHVPAVYAPETVTAYEAGIRTRFADHRFGLTAAVFYNDYKDVHAQSFLVQPIPGSPGAQEYFTNGGAMSAKGAEIELQWMPGRNWNIAAQVAYLDAKFGEYNVAPIEGLGDIEGHTGGDSLSLKGWRPALSPKWTVGVQASYLWHLRKRGTIKPYIQTSYTSEFSASDINLPATMQGAQTRTDLRIAWIFPGGRFRVEGYYMNAEDNASLNHVMVYNPSARPDLATIQVNWRDTQRQGIIFSYDF